MPIVYHQKAVYFDRFFKTTPYIDQHSNLFIFQYLKNLAFRVFRATFAVLNFSNKMANHNATKKDMRQSTKRRDRNRYYGKTTRNAIRDLNEVKDNKGAADQLPGIISMVDKLAKRGIIHKNKASNIKSKLTRKVNALATK